VNWGISELVNWLGAQARPSFSRKCCRALHLPEPAFIQTLLECCWAGLVKDLGPGKFATCQDLHSQNGNRFFYPILDFDGNERQLNRSCTAYEVANFTELYF